MPNLTHDSILIGGESRGMKRTGIGHDNDPDRLCAPVKHESVGVPAEDAELLAAQMEGRGCP